MSEKVKFFFIYSLFTVNQRTKNRKKLVYKKVCIAKYNTSTSELPTIKSFYEKEYIYYEKSTKSKLLLKFQ